MKKLGFNLIELMVVIAIIAILAAIAVPAFKNYQVKAKVTSAIPLLGHLKLLLSDFRERTGDWPTAIGDLNLTFDSWDSDTIETIDLLSPAGIFGCDNFTPAAYTGDMCVAIQFVDGVVPDHPLAVIILLANEDGNLTNWVCTTARSSNADSHIPQEYLPAGCFAS